VSQQHNLFSIFARNCLGVKRSEQITTSYQNTRWIWIWGRSKLSLRKKIVMRFHANSIEKFKIENLATLQRLELLLKIPAKNRGKFRKSMKISFVQLFVFSRFL
jgi:hypothetical protein